MSEPNLNQYGDPMAICRFSIRDNPDGTASSELDFDPPLDQTVKSGQPFVTDAQKVALRLQKLLNDEYGPGSPPGGKVDDESPE